MGFRPPKDACVGSQPQAGVDPGRVELDPCLPSTKDARAPCGELHSNRDWKIMMATTNVVPPLGRNLTYGLLDRIGRTIVTGGYDDRSFPTEAEISSEHSVSRSVTREAVKMLTAKGLLIPRPRQRTIVQPEASWNLFDPDVLR